MDIRKSLRESYNNHAAERDGHVAPEWKLEVRERFMSMLADERKASLIDIGAGTGRDSLYFMNKSIRVTAVDLSDEMVRICSGKGIDALRVDFHALGNIGRRFDAAWAMNSLLHVEKAKLKSVLQQIHGVLKPAGLFFMGVYGGEDSEGIWESDTYTPKRYFSSYTDESIQAEVSGVFDIIRFDRVEVGEDIDFQSIIMRKR